MSLTIASQLGDDINDELRRRMPALEIVAVKLGAPQAIADGIEVLLTGPIRAPGAPPASSAPPGWPFSLKWVQLVSAGIDEYPRWLFDGPTVTAAREVSGEALAEFAIAAIFSAAKDLPELWVHATQDWRPRPLRSVAGSTLGLAGFGAIGQALAKKALALDMRVLALRRHGRASDVAGIEDVQDIGTLFERSDHVVLGLPLTAQTQGIVNGDLLARAKPGLHLINLARGRLIDDDALLAALDASRLSRATLDVTYPEPLPDGHPFYRHPRVQVSAHTAAYTPETRESLLSRLLENLQRYRRGDALQHPVDIIRGY
ncbi:MAG: NAD(P)-dependent oxidoreductase [Solimonas sp.]